VLLVDDEFEVLAVLEALLDDDWKFTPLRADKRPSKSSLRTPPLIS
jgi:hypothetical protein